MLFAVLLVLFLICTFIQYKALHRMAFGRGLFITIAMFFFSFVIYIAPNAPRFFVWLVFLLTWAYILVITLYSIARLRKNR